MNRRRYVAWHNRSILPLLRIGLLAGAVLYSLNYVGDAALDPSGASATLRLRVATTIALFIAALLSYLGAVKSRPRTTLVLSATAISVPTTLIGLSLDGGGMFHVTTTQLATGIFAVLIAQEYATVMILAAVLFAVPNIVVLFSGPIPIQLLSADLLLASGCIGMVILSYLLEIDAVRLFKATVALRHQAETDALTGIANRRSILDIADTAFALARQTGEGLSVVMQDIDDFKKINDSHGHAVGDKVLARVANACVGNVRGVDSFGRIGGEEFLAVLPGTTDAEAFDIADRLRKTVGKLRFADDGLEFRVTVSVGVATLSDADADVETLVRRADTALYSAKARGRNRTEADHPA